VLHECVRSFYSFMNSNMYIFIIISNTYIDADLVIAMDNSKGQHNAYYHEPDEKSHHVVVNESAAYDQAPPAYDAKQQQHVLHNGTMNSMNCNGNQPFPVHQLNIPNVIIVVLNNPALPGQRSFCYSYLLSCLVFWFCGCVFGGIAFVLSGYLAVVYLLDINFLQLQYRQLH